MADDYEPRESTSRIDPDKVTDAPGLLPYAHHVGSAIIKPIDAGRTRGLAMSAMYEQTGTQLEQIKRQVELLLAQAQTIHDRIEVSESIYTAAAGFKPNVGQTCYLYERAGGERVLSLVGPGEWGKKPPFDYVATVRLLSDHTWDVEDMARRGNADANDEATDSEDLAEPVAEARA